MPSWGATDLNIIQDTYIPPHAQLVRSKGQLIPPTTGTDHAEVIQDGARMRRTVAWQGWVTSQAELDALLDDYYAGEVRTFTGYDSIVFDALIDSLTPGHRTFEWHIKYSITLVEES